MKPQNALWATSPVVGMLSISPGRPSLSLPGWKCTQVFVSRKATGIAAILKRLRTCRGREGGLSVVAIWSLGSRAPAHYWCFQHLFGGGGAREEGLFT